MRNNRGMSTATFGAQLRTAMGDMTQERLEELSGVSQSAISDLLLGKREPRLKTLVALERALPLLREIRHDAA